MTSPVGKTFVWIDNEVELEARLERGWRRTGIVSDNYPDWVHLEKDEE